MSTVQQTSLLALLIAVMSLIVACGDLDVGFCDPDFDDNCVCTLDDDGVTVVDNCVDGSTDDDDEEACTCSFENEDQQPDFNPDPEPAAQPDPEPEAAPLRFVLVEDLTPSPSGDFPGTDLDAIGLIKGDGKEIFADSIGADTFVDCEDNLACDINALLGAPDAINPETGECFGGGAPDGTQFTALNGGFVIVQFSSVVEGDVQIENGDAIHVYEIGAIECGRFDDDLYSVSVSISDEANGSFIELSQAGNGSNIVDVTGF